MPKLGNSPQEILAWRLHRGHAPAVIWLHFNLSDMLWLQQKISSAYLLFIHTNGTFGLYYRDLYWHPQSESNIPTEFLAQSTQTYGVYPPKALPPICNHPPPDWQSWINSWVSTDSDFTWNTLTQNILLLFTSVDYLLPCHEINYTMANDILDRVFSRWQNSARNVMGASTWLLMVH